jgi:hypothetical protein
MGSDSAAMANALAARPAAASDYCSLSAVGDIVPVAVISVQ